MTEAPARGIIIPSGMHWAKPFHRTDRAAMPKTYRDIQSRIIRQEAAVAETGLDAVAWYDGPDYGIGYLGPECRLLIVDHVSEEDAHEFITKAVRYGSEYADYRFALGLSRSGED